MKKKGWSTVPLVTNALPAPLAPSWIIVISRLLFLFFLPRARGVRSSRLFDPSKVGSGGSLVIVMSSYGGAQVAVDLSNSSCASYLRCPGLTPTAARVLRSAASSGFPPGRRRRAVGVRDKSFAQLGDKTTAGGRCRAGSDPRQVHAPARSILALVSCKI